jgi:hypothetical protein
MRALALPAATLLVVTPAFGHPGHDAPAMTHWMSDAAHLAVVVALAALSVVVIGAVLARRRLQARRKKD